jgi:signal transduction histidine kinase
VLRILQSLLRQPNTKRLQSLALRLLQQGGFDMVLVARLEAGIPGPSAVGLLECRYKTKQDKHLQEALQSQISPLVGMNDIPRWISLHEDPFSPGAPFLRKFNMASALVLPVGPSPGMRDGHDYLLAASSKQLEQGSVLVNEILFIWSLLQTVTKVPWTPGNRSADEASEWPGEDAWLLSPLAMAIIAGDELIQANPAARQLLKRCVGADGQAGDIWLVASVRRLLESGRSSDILLASRSRNCSLEVQVGPALYDGESRIVTMRDATAEVTADNRNADTISTLSHELRTPLTSMKNSVGLMLRGEAGSLSAEQEKFLALTMRNIDRLDRLIGDLLDASRGRSGELALRRRLVDLGVLLREALDMLSATARQHGITLDYTGIPASFPAHVDGDKVVQMILNTVGNALKYTEAGGFVRVWLRAHHNQLPSIANFLAEYFFLPLQTFTVVVEDNGMGMSQDILDNLFHPFRRGKEAEAIMVPGTGLGLHITRGLVNAHGGTIDLSSSPDLGTTVWIVLPRDPAAEKVLVASRKLKEDQRVAGGPTSFLCLDARQPDLQIEESASSHATGTVQGFLMRLDREAADAATTVPGGAEAEVRVHELVPGLWVAVGTASERLDSAWEVELAKPSCPQVLVGTQWKVVTLPAELSVPAVPESNQEQVQFTRKKV